MESSNYQTNHKSNLWFQLLRFNQFTSLLLMTSIVALPCILLPSKPILAQEATTASLKIAQSPFLSKNAIHVDSKNGDDSATGKKLAPLKTITQALKIAPPGSTINLASGTYSEATGETFPLILKDKITLQGDRQNQGFRTIIQGDGYFVSPTGAGQNITLAAIEDAGGITGITVTNNHSRGHGLWIESASPQVIANTFTRNGNTGVSVNGNSSPLIEDNYFYNNSGNGLLVYGTSKPEVVKNTFEQTGFGVSVVQQAAPILKENLFDGNRIGIILEGNSQGTLRNNEIINSSESGLTAIAQSRVDLGTDDEPGNNVFRSNKKLDIENATGDLIVAVGTEVQGDTTGEISFDSGTFVASNNSDDNTFKDLPPLQPNTVSSPLPKPDIPAPATPSTPATPVESTASDIPSPPPVLENASAIGNKELVFTAAASSVAMPDVEPVPFPPTINPITSIKYKVLVETLDESEESEVRSLYPEAFETVFQGESWLQIGAFSNLDKAKQAENNLANLGLETYLLE